MKSKITLLSIVLAIGMSGIGCKARKKAMKASDDTSAVLLEIQYSEQPCGGAAPPDDIFEEMSRLKPYVGKSVFISVPDGPFKVKNEREIKLNNEGKATIEIDSGRYFVSFYSIVPPVTDNKSKKTPEPPKEDAPEADQIQPGMTKEDCELQWKVMTATPLHITPGKKHYIVPMQKECNPCEEPRP